MTTFAITNNLDWKVEDRPLYFPSNSGQLTRHPNKVVIVRSDTDYPLGEVSHGYEILQNDILLSKVQPLVDEGLLNIENMGYLAHGAKVFVQAKVAEEFKVLGEDYQGFITLLNGHVGNVKVSLGVSTVRVICENTFAMAYNDIGEKFRHTEGVNQRVLESSEVMNYVTQAMDLYAKNAEVLAKSTCSMESFHKVVAEIYNKEVAEIRYIDTLNNLFYNGAGNEGKTYYDAFNAITEYGSKLSKTTSSGRFQYVNFGIGRKINQKAMSVLTEFATV